MTHPSFSKTEKEYLLAILKNNAWSLDPQRADPVIEKHIQMVNGIIQKLEQPLPLTM